jgi:hypothetical protein
VNEIDSAANNHQRFVRAQTADPFVWPGYDQQLWVSAHRFREHPWAELVELWVGLNGYVAQIIEGVPPTRHGGRTGCQRARAGVRDDGRRARRSGSAAKDLNRLAPSGFQLPAANCLLRLVCLDTASGVG